MEIIKLSTIFHNNDCLKNLIQSIYIKIVMKSGIYIIENFLNNKKYVGSAKNINKRWYQHKYTLNNNTHDNSYLQNAWNKSGKNNFNFIIIEEVVPENLLEREQYYIDLYNVCDRKNGYNLAPIAGNTLGFKYSEKSKLKMSLAKKNKPSNRKNYVMSEETKKKISNANKISQLGRTHSEETKEKMRKPHGAMSEDTKKKLSDWRKGLIPSEKTGKFINPKVKNTLLTKEVINKTKEINKNRISPMKGKHCSEETKQKLRNRIVSNETRIKLSASCKGKNIGENNGMAISNKNEVIAIRNDYDNGMTLSELQTKYNKKYMFIYKIVKRLRWAWLNDSRFS